MHTDNNYERYRHIHFIGIGGISMSGLACVLLNKGYKVSGSDPQSGPVTDSLAAKGARIYKGNLASNLDEVPDAVVYTAAIRPDNPELVRAKELEIPLLTRAELLGQIMKEYPASIGVSGTHGKTTVTSMLSHILINAGTDPTISVGGMLDKIGGNIRIGGGDIFLTEACEYTNSFLSLFPTMEIILNIEADHLDFFKDLDDIRHSFREYVRLLPKNGTLIINNSIRELSDITGCASCPFITYGDGGDVCAVNTSAQDGVYSFDVCAPGRACDGLHITLSVPGIHNVDNALAAIAAADALGVAADVTAASLKEFGGAKRRFQKKGTFNGAQIVDDYAHHPQEIAATLAAASAVARGRLRVIFQPHTYSRTKLLFDDFVKALCACDEAVIAKIYPARETDPLGMSAQLLSDAIAQAGTPSCAFEDFDELTHYIKDTAQPGDLIMTMGAGDIYKVGDALLS